MFHVITSYTRPKFSCFIYNESTKTVRGTTWCPSVAAAVEQYYDLSQHSMTTHRIVSVLPAIIKGKVDDYYSLFISVPALETLEAAYPEFFI